MKDVEKYLTKRNVVFLVIIVATITSFATGAVSLDQLIEVVNSLSVE